MDWIDALLKLSQIGSTALLAVAIYGVIRGYWVPGRTYEESVKRETAWREMYEREKQAREVDRDKERERAARV
jgi:hypothetical protein